MTTQTRDWRGPVISRYMRTASSLDPKERFEVFEGVAVGRISREEAALLSMKLRRGYLFARINWRTNLYAERIQELAQRSVIEVVSPGDPDEISSRSRSLAQTAEMLLLLCSVFSLPRKRFQRLLGIQELAELQFDVVFSADFRKLRTRSISAPEVMGIPIDDRFMRRFERRGFKFLMREIVDSSSTMVDRSRRSLDWLLQSRREVRLASSVVKTSTALESLLVFANSEPLAQVLSDRTAFLIGADTQSRQQVSHFIRQFYDVRSGVVHGTRRHRDLNDGLMEAADQITMMACLTLAANMKVHSSEEQWRQWFDRERWGSPDPHFVRLFSKLDINRALAKTLKP